jgi:hypothetical protein
MGAAIRSGGIQYVGISDQIKQTFQLTHKGYNIFQREFTSSGVDTSTGIITSINHFFVSGEELVCSGSDQIEIEPTVILGISTNKLPNTVYAIKVSNSGLKLASTAENALKYNPEYLQISSIPVGVAYTLTSKKQNTKSLISIDNVIQSPITKTSFTTTLNGSINGSVSELVLSDVTNFKSGDIIKIDDEIIRIISIKIGNSSTSSVARGALGTTKQSHLSGATVTKLSGNYNIVGNNINFSAAPIGIGTEEFGISDKSTFSGRVFLRSGEEEGTNETYNKNYVFDDISDQFINISNDYTLKVDGSDVDGVSDNGALVLIKQNAQTPRRLGNVNINGDYYLEESLPETKLNFTGDISQHPNDISASSIPIGGKIISCASTEGSGYQPLVSAGGTAFIVSGSISSVSIGNSGSGYRSGPVNVGIVTTTGEITIIGSVSVLDGHIQSPVSITNPGSGFTTPPQIIIDRPIGYYNIPLVYSSISSVGIGTSATVDLYVDQEGNIKNFEISNTGYGYQVGEILTVGIPTDSTVPFSEFRLTIQEVDYDEFSSWTFGELELFDPIDNYFNGVRKKFRLRKNGIIKSVIPRRGSNIDPAATLLVFINNILQVPGESYTFNGGSAITFVDAPSDGDTSRIIFYRGTKDIDIEDIDILEEIEPGDYVQVSDDELALTEDDRLVTEIQSVDSILTNPYPGPGLSLDTTYQRPVEVCKSREDKFINGISVTKDRIWYEPIINPISNIIQSVGIGTTAEIYVESVKTFFDNKKENYSGKKLLTLQLIDQELTNVETFIGFDYKGDFGEIAGISTDIVSPGYNTLTFDLIIPYDSYLRDSTINTSSITQSQIQENYYFVVTNSNVGYGITSLRDDGSIVSTGSSFIDNVYRVISKEDVTFNITTTITVNTEEEYSSPTVIDSTGTLIIDDDGIVTISGYDVVKVTVRVDDFNNIDQDLLNPPNSNYFGNYSWGRIYTRKRKYPKSFDWYPNGLVGIETSPILRRLNPLRYYDYTS